MKPDADVSGMPFNFDAIPMWLYPDVWDETKQVRLRGLWFVLLYALSASVFISFAAIVLGLIFSRSLILMFGFSLLISVPAGSLMGLGSWWDFTRRRKKLLLEEEVRKKSEAQAQESSTE